MTMITDSERAFYHQTIARLLEYNGTLITALVSRGQPVPMPVPPPMSFGGLNLGGDPMQPVRFGIQMEPGDQEKLQSAWKDHLLAMKKVFDQNFNLT